MLQVIVKSFRIKVNNDDILKNKYRLSYVYLFCKISHVLRIVQTNGKFPIPVKITITVM